MRISFKYKFIFISNPKTGSESMREMLNPFTDIYSNTTDYYHHTNCIKLKYILEKKKYIYEDFFIFGFIRNPWDRAVSYYLYCKPDDKCNAFWIENYNENKKFIYNFNEWIRYHIEKKKKIYGLINIYDFFGDENGKLITNKIYKMEEMDKAIKDINKKCNINIKNMIHINKSSINKKHYSFYYNKESYLFIKELMKKDIDYGNYSFENLNIDLNF